MLRRVLLILPLLLLAALVHAQELTTSRDAGDPLYPFWEEIATEAEKRIDDPDVSTETLEEQRRRIANFRAEFALARSANADRIATLSSQLQALGDPPEDGNEAPEVTAKRVQLNTQLEELRAPILVAEASFQRSEGLIAEIDRIIRERQTQRLLSLGPSPLDPRTWPVALTDIQRILTDIANGTELLGETGSLRKVQEQLPVLLVLLAISLTLIVRGRTWAGHAVNYMRRFGGRGSGVWSFLVSLLRIIIPLAGVFIFAATLSMTDLLGTKSEIIVGFLPVMGLILLGFRWLAERLFARNDDEALILLPGDKRRLARYYLLILSLLFVLRFFIEVFFGAEHAVAEATALVAFPIVVLIGLVLLSIGMILRRFGLENAEKGEDSAQKAGLQRALRFAGNVMVGVGVTAPVMAAVGYAEAGNAMLYPTLLSMVLLGLVIVLQRFLADVYGLVTGQGVEARDGLVAILAGFVLMLAALPVLALIWGARVADLTELWTQFLQGFDIGGTRISPSNFLTFVIVFVIGYTITRLLQSTLRQNVLPKTRIDIGGQNALVSGLGYVGIFLAALIAVTVAGLDLSGLAIVAGALSVGIGFGLQTIVSNFVSGIILLVERPISEGDWIEVGGQMGYVKHISVRSTRIETFDRTDVIIPNSDLVSGTVTNYTRGNTIGRLIVPVGVAYGTDTMKVDGILREIAEAQPMVLRNPPPVIVFMGFGADSLNFEIRAILRDVNWSLSIRNDINHAIAARFAEEGIEIPFAQRDIWLRNPEVLRPARDTGE